MIQRSAAAGTMEKGDAQVTVTPLEGGREIRVLKVPHPRFRTVAAETAAKVLEEEKAEGLRVEVSDFGALDFVIEARVRSAVRAARGETSC